MVKAYTLSDKIVQQGFNDFESVVGLVYKYSYGGDIELSSVEALRESGATPINIGQVTGYHIVDSFTSSQRNTYTDTAVFTGSMILQILFNGWQSERLPEICDQWVVIRRLESTPYVDLTTPFVDYPTRILYKIVADCYLSVVEP